MQSFEPDRCQYLEPLNERQSVFLARDAHSGELFAVRRLRAEQAATYRKLQGASVPHTPAVRFLAEEAVGFYLEFEDYIPGISLDLYLQEHGPDEQEAVNVAMQLCEALSALHGLGIIHRDIKPGNVLLTKDHQAYLIDFDISRIAKPAQGQDTALLGTCGYAAPEQFGFRQTDERTDIYSLGVLLNVMSTGQFPHGIPAGGALGDIIAKCVSIDPDNRYADANALRLALAALVPEGNRAAPAAAAPSGRKVFPLPHLNQIPGFRRGNLFFEIIALLAYSLAAILAVAFLALAVQSLENFILVAFLFLLVIGWYMFLFDLAGVRARIRAVEKHRGEPLYALYCACAMAMWFILIFTVLFLLSGIRTLFLQ